MSTGKRSRNEISATIEDGVDSKNNKSFNSSSVQFNSPNPTTLVTSPLPSYQYQSTPVPAAELDAAIAAIQTTVDHMYKVKVLESTTTTTSSTSPTNDKNNDSLVDHSNHKESTRVIFDQLQSSVVNELRKLVKPVSWEEYEKVSIKFDTPMRQKLQRLDDVNTEDDDLWSRSSSDTEEEDHNLITVGRHEISDKEQRLPVADDEDDDEEDLLDLDAVSRVLELRNQVREAAERTRTTRSKQIDRLVSFITKEVESWTEIPPKEEKESIIPEKQEGEEQSLTDKDERLRDNRKQLEYLDTMKSSLTNLSETLNKIDLELPEQLELLSDTLDTIDHSLKQKEEGVISSGTEKAILSRVGTKNNISRMKENEENLDKNGIALDPEQRFASFMANA